MYQLKTSKIRCLLTLFPLLLLPGQANAWRSTLYPTNWQAPVDGVVSFESSKMIQDFSYAGYRGGENGIPNVGGTLFNVTQPPYNADKTGGSDTTLAIQSAINAAQAAGGGVVYLPAGTYSIRPQASNNYALLITAPNIVLRGEGAGQTFLLNTSTNMRSKSIILLNGPSAAGMYSSGVASTNITRNLLGPTAAIPSVEIRMALPSGNGSSCAPIAPMPGSRSMASRTGWATAQNWEASPTFARWWTYPAGTSSSTPPPAII